MRKGKIARETSKLLEDWVNTKIPINIQGQTIGLEPTYLSAMFKWHNFEKLEIYNNKLIDAPKKSLESCILLTSSVGKDARGSGISKIGMPDLPQNTEYLIKNIDHSLDTLMKNAAQAYLEGVSNMMIVKKDDMLNANGYHDKINFSQKGFTKRTSVKEFEELVKKYNHKLQQVNGVWGTNSTITTLLEESLFVDTKRSKIYQFNDNISFTYLVQAKDNQKEEFSTATQIIFSDKEQIDERIINIKIEKLIEVIKAKKNSVPIKSGPYPAILDGAAVATLMHEAVAAHLLSGKYITEGDSTIYAGRLGEEILPDVLTVIDDPTLPGGTATYHYDEEGVKAEKVVLVENGILKNYLLDKTSAALLSRRLGKEIHSNGKSRSEWAIGEPNIMHPHGTVITPEPRVTNLLVTSSEMNKKEDLYYGLQQIMKNNDSKYGLIVEGGGGEVDIEDGNFVLHPEKVWRVDKYGDKKLVKGVKIVSTPDEIFHNLIATGEPYRTSYGICGAQSGYVTTQERAPAFLLDRIGAVTEKEIKLTERLRERI